MNVLFLNNLFVMQVPHMVATKYREYCVYDWIELTEEKEHTRDALKVAGYTEWMFHYIWR